MVPRDSWWTSAVALALPAPVLLSTLCELSHDWPPDSTSFSAHSWLPGAPCPCSDVASQTTTPCRATHRTGQVVSLG